MLPVSGSPVYDNEVLNSPLMPTDLPYWGNRAERQSDQMSKITNDHLTLSGTGCFIAVPIWQQWASKCQTQVTGGIKLLVTLQQRYILFHFPIVTRHIKLFLFIEISSTTKQQIVECQNVTVV